MPEHRRAPRVALIHYWLVGMRGGEKVLEALCRMYPDADIFTHVADRDALSDTLRRHTIHETWIGRLPAARRLYQAYLPLMPRALEGLDLSGYDLVISSEAGPAKGVIVPPDAFHLCYCHSPMRYLWDQYHVYRAGTGSVQRAAMSVFAHGLRQWDVTSAARVDAFAANSHHVADRIKKYWRRDASVVHPPVAVEDFAPVPPAEVGDSYLWLGELAPYKRPDMAVEAFNRLGLPLTVIGGPQKTVDRLAAEAEPNITFLGKTDFDTLRDHLSRCKALIFPGEEDFGIVPVEAMAAGRPVIAYGRGGACDTVVEGQTGLLFPDQSVEDLVAAVLKFEASHLAQAPSEALVRHAAGFSEDVFRQGIRALLPPHLRDAEAPMRLAGSA
ncbi:glycosyl transferase [Jannaschia pagri]|uniref:Glycosyl transferase n=1 Tax=Jannaschia pagri TaxID=2829797 RepID=A0ABQ4NN67_9RHOB|nr:MULTISPECIES: glycosyltransferase [unclassified Jannaschia]GIT92007.1 glycosyl transferase [Jannaschia sp. AI_61]GIT95841.1 glycosyl transferase [Jannaschia sp. AI_62]